ncbi:hypothetical protein IAT38_007855 [Cryptococcus sp. DSM 104549]
MPPPARQAPLRANAPPRGSRLPLFFALIFPLLNLFLQSTPIHQPKGFNLIQPGAGVISSGDGGEGAEVERRKALLLTAHPDDEVMFFGPTVLGLVKAGWDVSGLCLSTGDSDGLGQVRKAELIESYETLGVPPTNVVVVDHPQLQDGMDTQWDDKLIAQLVEETLATKSIELIITFDDQGITHHPNHVSLPRALSLLPHTSSSPSLRVLTLLSPDTLLKFTGPLYILYLHLRSALSSFPAFEPLLALLEDGESRGERHVVVSDFRQYSTAVNAMRKHGSQLVWFRWLYLAFSRLMWVNELVEVEHV